MIRSTQVPWLRPEQIEHAVNELRKNYRKHRNREVRPPIPIDDIVEFHLGLDFRLDDLRALLGLSDVLGATWFEKKRIVVDASLEHQEGRYAFTLAHEVGHWLLHRPLYEMEKTAPLLFPREGSQPLADVVCRDSQRAAPAEWQANQFAARLLMPADDVRAAVSRLRDASHFVEDIDAIQSAQDPVAFRRLAAVVIDDGGFSNVSNEAMRVRLQELSIIKLGASLKG